MDSRNGIDWAHIGRDDFERFVEALLVRWYRSDPERGATAVDGRGGDSGIDVDVRKGDKTVHVYQLKHFPEGFSGNWKGRRQQIKKSFEAAMKVDGLQEWTLVIPGNGTPGERKAVGSLRDQRSVRIRIIGRAELDEMFSQQPDLLAWATRDSLVKALRQAGHESDALTGPDDLAIRVRNLAALADTRSIFWGVRLSEHAGQVEQQFFAKRPDAAEREPIEIRFATRFAAEHEALRHDYQLAMDFGLTKPLHLPHEVIEAFQVLGPEWIARDESAAEIELQPRALDHPIRAEIRVITIAGATVSSLRGEITVVVEGRVGMTFQANFRGCYVMRFLVPRSGSAGTVNMSYDLTEVGAADALAVLRFVKTLGSGNQIQLIADQTQVFKMISPVRTDAGESEPVDDGLFSLVDDLAYLEHEFGLSLTIPAKHSDKERINIRIARMLAEGKCAIWPGVSGFNGTLEGTADDGLLLMLKGPHAHLVSAPDWEIEIRGERIVLGTLRVYHPSLQVKDPEVIAKAIENGTAEGLRIETEPTDGTGFRVWIQERWPDPEKKIVPEPWEIPGIEEPPDPLNSFSPTSIAFLGSTED